MQQQYTRSALITLFILCASSAWGMQHSKVYGPLPLSLSSIGKAKRLGEQTARDILNLSDADFSAELDIHTTKKTSLPAGYESDAAIQLLDKIKELYPTAAIKDRAEIVRRFRLVAATFLENNIPAGLDSWAAAASASPPPSSSSSSSSSGSYSAPLAAPASQAEPRFYDMAINDKDRRRLETQSIEAILHFDDAAFAQELSNYQAAYIAGENERDIAAATIFNAIKNTPLNRRALLSGRFRDISHLILNDQLPIGFISWESKGLKPPSQPLQIISASPSSSPSTTSTPPPASVTLANAQGHIERFAAHVHLYIKYNGLNGHFNFNNNKTGFKSYAQRIPAQYYPQAAQALFDAIVEDVKSPSAQVDWTDRYTNFMTVSEEFLNGALPKEFADYKNEIEILTGRDQNASDAIDQLADDIKTAPNYLLAARSFYYKTHMPQAAKNTFLQNLFEAFNAKASNGSQDDFEASLFEHSRFINFAHSCGAQLPQETVTAWRAPLIQKCIDTFNTLVTSQSEWSFGFMLRGYYNNQDLRLSADEGLTIIKALTDKIKSTEIITFEKRADMCAKLALIVNQFDLVKKDNRGNNDKNDPIMLFNATTLEPWRDQGEWGPLLVVKKVGSGLVYQPLCAMSITQKALLLGTAVAAAVSIYFVGRYATTPVEADPVFDQEVQHLHKPSAKSTNRLNRHG